MYTSRIVTYYVNNKNRTLACAHIHAPTRRCYVILTTLFAFSAQQLFFLHRQYVYVCVCERREKKGKIFVLLKELACTHLMYECMYGRRKKKCMRLVEKRQR